MGVRLADARLTGEHRAILESQWRSIERVASRFSSAYGDDEFLGFVSEYLCRKVGRFDPSKGDPRGWAISRARLACIEYLDSRKRRRVPVVYSTVLVAEAQASCARPEPWAEASAREEAERLLGVLTAKQRYVVENSVLGGKTMEAIGREMGVATRSAWKLKMRAFEKMRAAS